MLQVRFDLMSRTRKVMHMMSLQLPHIQVMLWTQALNLPSHRLQKLFQQSRQSLMMKTTGRKSNGLNTMEAVDGHGLTGMR